MKTKLIVSALIAVSMAASGSAMAQRGDHNDNGDRGQQQQQQHNNDRNDGPRGNNNNNNNDHRNYDARNFRSDNHRGGGPRQDLRRGQRLSPEYRDNRYVVNDWRARHLAPPPRGQHWVQAGNDYVLVAIASGLIAQILLSN